MKFSTEILKNLVSFSCPKCGYEVEIQLLDARVQAYRFCPCCHARIHLVDASGSMFGELEAIDLAMQELNETLRRMF